MPTPRTHEPLAARRGLAAHGVDGKKDPMTTMAAIDRVVHHSIILDLMTLESYRTQEANGNYAATGPPGRRMEQGGTRPAVAPATRQI
jgi:hypothetical protein